MDIIIYVFEGVQIEEAIKKYLFDKNINEHKSLYVAHQMAIEIFDKLTIENSDIKNER
jgi:hypothetical protein